MGTSKPARDKDIAIIESVDMERKRSATRPLDISLNELADMYKTKELNISPEFQRLFRWSRVKQSQLIESLILEMPIPPIFVIEEKTGKWELIDGLQRLSTYLHFRGALDAPMCKPSIKKGSYLRLEGCDIVPDLSGLRFDDLPPALQIRLKRSYFRVEVVRKETHPRFKYYMFKRLNTGGEALEDQEVRNCTIRLLGDKFNNFIKELKGEEFFQKCIAPLTDEKRRRMIDVELVLRFFAFKNYFDKFKHDVGPFLTQYMEGVSDEGSVNAIPFDYKREKGVFMKTFTFLGMTLGVDTCKRWTGNGFGGGFSNHHYEAFTLGTARLIDSIDPTNEQQLQRAKEALSAVKKNTEFQGLSKGGGQNSPGLYRKKIEMVADGLGSAL